MHFFHVARLLRFKEAQELLRVAASKALRPSLVAFAKENTLEGELDWSLSILCNKKLLGAPGLTTRSKDATRGSCTRSKDATRGSWPYY